MFNLAAADAENRQRRQRPLCWSPLARQPASKEAVGGGRLSACYRLWGTHSSSPPLWSSSFDHLSNPGSAPPFAFFFLQKWMSSVQNFSAGRRGRLTFERDGDVVVCGLKNTCTQSREQRCSHVEWSTRIANDLHKVCPPLSIKPFQNTLHCASSVLQKASNFAASVFDIIDYSKGQLVPIMVQMSSKWSCLFVLCLWSKNFYLCRFTFRDIHMSCDIT